MHRVQTLSVINELNPATFQNVPKQQPVRRCKHFVSGCAYFVTNDRFCQISTTDRPSNVIKAINCELRHRSKKKRPPRKIDRTVEDGVWAFNSARLGMIVSHASAGTMLSGSEWSDLRLTRRRAYGGCTCRAHELDLFKGCNSAEDDKPKIEWKDLFYYLYLLYGGVTANIGDHKVPFWDVCYFSCLLVIW